METLTENRTPSPAFPPPVEPCDTVEQVRAARTARLLRVAGAGIGVRVLVIAGELAGASILGHSVLLVDALASLADVVASLAIIGAILLAQRPPDDEHPFGHGRYEPLAGLQLGVLITLAGGYLLVDQLTAALRQPAAGFVALWVWTIPAVAALLLEGCSRAALRSGRRENSSALVAEAWHYRVDAVTSALASVGLVVAAFAPQAALLLDHLFAMLLAAIMVGVGVAAVRENLHPLLDRAPDERWFERVRRSAETVAGVLEIEKIRIQQAGPDAHVDIDIEVDPRQTVSEAHRIAQHVRARVQTDWPSVREVVVHVEPFYEGDH